MGETQRIPDAYDNGGRVARISTLWLKDKAYLLRISLFLNHGNKEDSEDLLSQALLKILSNKNYSAENILNPRALFIDVVRKEFFSRYRKRKRHYPVRLKLSSTDDFPAREIIDDAPTQFDQYAGKEEMILVMEGMQKLSGPLRKALTLRIFGGCGYNTISEQLHISEALARKRVQLARQSLRTFLRSEKNLSDFSSQ